MKSIFSLFVFLFSLFASTLIEAQVNPVQMGRTSNAYTVLKPEQNQVSANDSTGIVVFIHRQDVTIWGGGSAESGKLRYDLSVDGGTTFTNDVGVLDSLYIMPARYPQVCVFNPYNSSNPFNLRVAWAAPTLNASPAWDGFASGVANVSTTFPLSSEEYNQIGNSTYLPTSLCEGLPNEFWMVDFDYDGASIGDSIRIFKGTYGFSSGVISWAKHASILMPYNKSYSGTSYKTSPLIAFSPDGNTGWVAFLGDLTGGPDSTFNPVFMKSTDGGATWGSPEEIDLANIPYISNYSTIGEELQSLWVDTTGNPVSSGRPTCAFEADLTVDVNGNPHLFVTVGSASVSTNPLPAYSVYSNLAKVGIDVSSDNGGASWKAIKIAPIYAFRGSFGSTTTVTMDNYNQISRTEDGEYIFYSWADSDTTVTGFGNSSNDAPNLRISGFRISDGYQTCPKWITNGDLIWDGKALWPTMAPTVLSGDGVTADYKLPIVITEILTGDILSPCQFYYFGNDATFIESDFSAPGANLNLDSCTFICTTDPSAGFYFSANALTVNFTDTSKVVGPSTYFWDFGDGNTSSQQNPSHTYSASGNYTVCLIVNDYCGADTICQLVNVTSTGIQESGKEFIKVFPNPGDGHYNVELLGFENEELDITISDITGKTVYQENKNNPEFVLNVSFLEKGIYVLKVNGLTRSVSTRLIIM